MFYTKTAYFIDPKFFAIKRVLLLIQNWVFCRVNHGVSIRIVASVNSFVLHSVSSNKVWVFAVKLIDDGDGEMVKLMRCAVIECSVPVWSISVSSGLLILGEDNGVRVFNLRQLLKWKGKKVKGFVWNGKLDGKGLKSPNGVGDDYDHISSSGNACNGALDGKTDKHCVSGVCCPARILVLLNWECSISLGSSGL